MLPSRARPALPAADDTFAEYDAAVDSVLDTASMPKDGAFAPLPEFPGQQTSDEQYMQVRSCSQHFRLAGRRLHLLYCLMQFYIHS